MASIFLISMPLPLASLQVDEEHGEALGALLDLVGRRGAGEQQHQVGVQHAAGPDLLAVDDVAVVALFLGAGLELGGVGAGGGLGDAEGLQAQRARGDARQVLLLLGGIAVPEHGAHGVHLGVAGRRVAAGLVDGLEDGAAGRQRQAGAAVLLGDQRAEVAGLGERGDELGGVGAVVVELHPVGVGKLLADAPHALADLVPAGIEGDGRRPVGLGHSWLRSVVQRLASRGSEGGEPQALESKRHTLRPGLLSRNSARCLTSSEIIAPCTSACASR